MATKSAAPFAVAQTSKTTIDGPARSTAQPDDTRCVLRYEAGYTGVVKTAVSLPDELFRRADHAASRLRMSRSQLYAAAISDFLERNRVDDVTERLNAIYSEVDAKVDRRLHRLQVRSIGRESW